MGSCQEIAKTERIRMKMRSGCNVVVDWMMHSARMNSAGASPATHDPTLMRIGHGILTSFVHPSGDVEPD